MGGRLLRLLLLLLLGGEVADLVEAAVRPVAVEVEEGGEVLVIGESSFVVQNISERFSCCQC